MNAILPQFLKSFYRKDPIISVLITMGIMDALIGGLDDSWSLFAFGLGTTGVALGLKLASKLSRSTREEERTFQYYLPPTSSSSSLPIIKATKNKPHY
ncbi:MULTISPECIES: hypothetical protein [Cylindrospermopsis]|jgi:hypothetical protein|uniref:hypothetical protein n=1 Tax=Cylindrospermopsis TaxID=77021 RepID=UPI00070C70CA|nr:MULTISPECIES: hypothetical protein [Cylindrospermopsis]MBU6344370.1 hypothetical protein [Cyanobacteria bacterium REEB494]KRH96387.1 hypothetical protein ASL19_08215 [Cylindrospermopsis sp. CR12]TPX29830.1 hypothetical protein FIV49_05705 [Cylindrospermopsis raciborskii GIHE 2018]UJL32993.1 hypothetical protein C6N34_012700 [Cylindrospermopsis raciborskii Cr2010]UJS05479.1 hypothetical protein L3I90_04380 [Cylindrospermopsis raciborskii KLL07]